MEGSFYLRRYNRVVNIVFNQQKSRWLYLTLANCFFTHRKKSTRTHKERERGALINKEDYHETRNSGVKWERNQGEREREIYTMFFIDFQNRKIKLMTKMICQWPLSYLLIYNKNEFFGVLTIVFIVNITRLRGNSLWQIVKLHMQYPCIYHSDNYGSFKKRIQILRLEKCFIGLIPCIINKKKKKEEEKYIYMRCVDLIGKAAYKTWVWYFSLLSLFDIMKLWLHKIWN